MKNTDEDLYAQRNVSEQGQVYIKHVDRMTAEKLHSKADIAAELAHRDIEIRKLQAVISSLKDILWQESNRTVTAHNAMDEGIKMATKAIGKDSISQLGG